MCFSKDGASSYRLRCVVKTRKKTISTLVYCLQIDYIIPVHFANGKLIGILFVCLMEKKFARQYNIIELIRIRVDNYYHVFGKVYEHIRAVKLGKSTALKI